MSDYTPAVMDFLRTYLNALRREVLNSQKMQVMVTVAKLVFLGALSAYVLVEHPQYVRQLVLFLPFVALSLDLVVLRWMEHSAEIEAYIQEHMETAVNEVDSTLRSGWIGWETYRRGGSSARAKGMLTHLVVYWGSTWAVVFACVGVASWSYDRSLLPAYILMGVVTLPLIWALFAGAHRYGSSERPQRKGRLPSVLTTSLLVALVLGVPMVGGVILRHSYPFEDLFHKEAVVSMKAMGDLLQKILLRLLK